MNKYMVLKGFLIALALINLSQQSFAQATRQVKYIFEGNKVFSSEELMKAFDNCRNKYQKPDTESFDRINDYCLRTSIRLFMFNKGYLKAGVGNVRKEQAGNDLQIIIPVVEEKQYRLGEIEVDGVTIFSRKDVLDSFPMKKGDIVNASLILQWLFSLEDSYANKGFVQFSGEPEPTFVGNIVNIKFILDEGRSFKVGRIEFVTDTNLRSNYFRRYLSFDEGEVFSNQKLRETIEKINSLKEFQPIDFDKDVDLISHNEIPLVNLTIHIKKKEQ